MTGLEQQKSGVLLLCCPCLSLHPRGLQSLDSFPPPSSECDSPALYVDPAFWSGPLQTPVPLVPATHLTLGLEK
ncbi:hypothetical protein GN956_G6611 [Arapaima gigas]